MKTIMLSNQKGGVAKTTTALALASGLAKRGFKVLAIDSDPQYNFTFSSGIDPLRGETTLYDIYEKTATIEQAITATQNGYDVICGDIRLTVADLAYSGKTGREYILKKAVESVKDKYDYCIIDTPPQIGLLVENALAITNSIIIPLTADVYAIQGLFNYSTLLKDLKEDLIDAKFNVEGLLITRYSNRTNLSKKLKEDIQEIADTLGTKVFNSKIREAVAVREAPLTDVNIFDSNPTATATKDYDDFINELLESGV